MGKAGGGGARRRRQEQAARRAAQRRKRVAMGVVATALLVGVAVLLARGGGPQAGSGNPGAWDLPRLGAPGRLRLADFRGKPTVVNFFASWCTQCEVELPGFAKVSRELSGHVSFVGVNSLDDGHGLDMARRFGIDAWPLAVDLGSGDRGELHDNLGVEGMPVTAFYDAAGKLLSVAPGSLPEPELRARLRALYGPSW